MSKSKKMKYQTLESLQPLIEIVNEAAEMLNDKNRTLRPHTISETIGATIGSAIGSTFSLGTLKFLGTTGLSASGITSGLATAGGFVGGGMVAGIFVLAAPIAVCAAGGAVVVGRRKNALLRQEKERLYQDALRKSEAMNKKLKEDVNDLKKGSNADKEKIEDLQRVNVLLRQVIMDLKKDLE